MAALLALVLFGLLAFGGLLSIARKNNLPTLPPPVVQSPQSGELFPNAQPDAITRVIVTDETSGLSVTWTKVPGGWQAVRSDGLPVAVDLTNVARMIQILPTLRYNRVLEESNVAQFGLSGQGQAQIEFEMGNGVPNRLRIGNADPSQTSVYVQRGDEPTIYLVPSGPVALVLGALPAVTPTP